MLAAVMIAAPTAISNSVIASERKLAAIIDSTNSVGSSIPNRIAKKAQEEKLNIVISTTAIKGLII